jgi:thioredoxin reductase (NADPH)
MISTSIKNLQVLIIGAGPIGLACGLACQSAGLSYLIVEKGCLVNSLYHYPSTMTFFSTSERLEIGGVPFVSVSAKPTRAEALEYYRRVVQTHKLAVGLFEEVLHCQPEAGNYKITTTKQEYVTQHIIVATGFYDKPHLLNIPGENTHKVSHYYKDPHFYAFQKVVVVGANNSAVDAALETWRKGAQVSLVVREASIGKSVKYWARPDIENRISEGSIKAYFNAKVVEIKPSQVVISSPSGVETIANDWVLAMTGYQSQLSFLEKLGIELSLDAQQKPLFDASTMETNQPNVFIAGVICGGMDTRSLFIENSRHHAQLIVQHILATQT